MHVDESVANALVINEVKTCSIKGTQSRLCACL